MKNISKDICKASEILKNGDLVAFPTETVYGLGADSTNVSAIRKIFEAKNRPINHPLILHIYDFIQVENWTSQFNQHAKELANKYWPGPLTLICKKKKSVNNFITGGQNTIALRMPSHPLARKLLSIFKKPIVAPSANKFGSISPTSAEDVFKELGYTPKLIINGGTCEIGLESTIIDVSSDTPVLLRPGILKIKDIEKVIKKKLSFINSKSIRTSGLLNKHYAPSASLRIIHEEKIESYISEFSAQKSIAVLSMRKKPKKTNATIWQQAPSNINAYAKKLYSLIRRLDESGCNIIIVGEIPNTIEWLAINDRLMRASDNK